MKAHKLMIMKLANAVDGAVKGITTLGVITDTLQNLNTKAKPVNILSNGKLKNKLKKSTNKKGAKVVKQYISLAGDLIKGASGIGIAHLGKKQNAMLLGSILGGAAGLGTLLFQDEKDKAYLQIDGKDLFPNIKDEKTRKVIHNILHVSLYTMGGLLAGKVVKEVGKANKKKKRS